MPSAKRITKRKFDLIQIYSVIAVACLAFVCARPAFSAEESTESSENPAQLEFAPVRFRPSLGGNIDYTTRRDNVAGVNSRSQYLTVNVNAGADLNTFIWQPWFAQVSGGLALNTYFTDTDYNSGVNSTSSKTESSAITGRAALDLVPLSRFPFKAYAEKRDNRQNVGYASANTSTQTIRYGLSQSYRTLSGKTNYGATYDQSRWEGGFGEDRQRRLGIDIATVLSANQNLSINGNNTFSEHLNSNQSTQSDTLNVRHSYRPSAAVTVENMANLGSTNYKLVTGENEDKYTQLSSYISKSSGEKPLTLTGSARLSGISNSTPLTSARQSSASATLGASYQLSQQVRTYGNMGVNLNDDKNSGTQSMSSYQSAGADYRSDRVDLGTFRYGTHASGSLSNNKSSVGSTQSAALAAGHGLTRSTSESGRVRLDTNVDQTVSANKSTRNPPSTSLSHSGSMGWTFAGEGGTTGLRLGAGDTRTLNNPKSFFQQANLQVNRNEAMTRNSSLSGDLTIQASRQGAANTPRPPTTVNSSANLNYRHQRIFGVPRLNFNSDVRIYSDSFVPLAVGEDRRDSRSWRNQLQYSIGQLQLMADMNFAQSNNVNSSSMMFRASRAF